MKLELQGLDKSFANIDKLAKQTKQEVQGELNYFGFDVEQQAKQLVASNSSDEGSLLRSIHHVPGNLEVSIVASIEHAAWIEFGTRKFAAVYVNSLPKDWQTYAQKFRGSGTGNFKDFMQRLLGWMKRKGIEESAAYPIARKLMIQGIKPKPFLYPAFRDNVPKLKARLKEVIK